MTTPRNQREDLRELLEESPSLVHTLHNAERWRWAYARAVSEASIETGIDESALKLESRVSYRAFTMP